MSYLEVYFAVVSISTIAVAGLLVLSLMYVLSTLFDIKRLSKIARREAEAIARGLEKGAGILGNELSKEAAGFLKIVFTLLLSQFAGRKTPRTKRGKIKSI